MHTGQIETAVADDLERSPFEADYETHADERGGRVTTEPIRLAAHAFSYLMVGVDDPQAHAHPFEGKCKVCDKPLEGQLWRQIDHRLAPGYFPINCCDVCFEEAKVDHERLRRNREAWERLCPTEFRTDWDNAKGSQALFKRVMDWGNEWNVAEQKAPKKGLLIHGDSSTAKTRICWQLCRKLAEEGVPFLFIEAMDLLDELPKAAFHVPCLVIDDLGNDSLDYKKEQRLLKLLRSRSQWHRPYVVTTQYVGSDLVARFSQEPAGEAVVRRLREFCEPVRARAPGEGAIKRDANGRAMFS